MTEQNKSEKPNEQSAAQDGRRKKRVRVPEAFLPDLERRLEENLKEKSPEKALKLQETVERLRPTIKRYLDQGWTILDIATALKGPDFDIAAATLRKYYEAGSGETKPSNGPKKARRPAAGRTRANQRGANAETPQGGSVDAAAGVRDSA